MQVLGRLEKVSLSLLPPGSGAEDGGSTTLMQEIESFVSPRTQRGKIRMNDLIDNGLNKHKGFGFAKRTHADEHQIAVARN